MVSFQYGLIGSGRVSRHWQHYLKMKNLTFRVWDRHSPLSPGQALDRCRVILVLISDSALVSFYTEHKSLLDSRLSCHFSGSTVIEGLPSFHPLMTFGNQMYSEQQYEEIPFVGEEGSNPFSDYFPSLKNPCTSISPKDKKLYHALCVLSGNFTVLLWQKTASLFSSELSLPKEILQPYRQSIFNNMNSDLDKALTGPLVRNDTDTIRDNLKALEPLHLDNLYSEFQKIYQNRENTI